MTYLPPPVNNRYWGFRLLRYFRTWADEDSRLLVLSKEQIDGTKAGFFAGLQVRMQGGTTHKFRCGKSKAIAAMLA